MSKRAAGVSHKTPPGYELAGHWCLATVKGWGLVTILAGGTCIFVVTLILGVVVRGILQGSGDFHISVGLAFPIFLAIIAAFVILHEGVHGLVFLVFDGKPRFGAKLIGGFFPIVYASAAGAFLSRNHYLLVGLAPFLVLTPLFLFTGILIRDDDVALITLTAMAMNIAGSTGDFMVARKVRQLGGRTLFEDTADGFNWYCKGGESVLEHRENLNYSI
jgi:hypothetical protein